MGFGSSLKDGMGRGHFHCSIEYLRKLLKRWDFRRVKPSHNPRKIPKDGKEKIRDMALRIAYFVYMYQVPPELVQNWDQSGIMFLQQKGRTWSQKGRDAGQTQHHGDKRQFTATFGSTASGEFLPCQLVFQGKTVGKSRQVPKYGGLHLR